MKSLLMRIVGVVLVTALSVLFLPGVDDVVEFGFQILVLIAAR